jgi:hypothetical protein
MSIGWHKGDRYEYTWYEALILAAIIIHACSDSGSRIQF